MTDSEREAAAPAPRLDGGLRALFEARSIAIIGASGDPTKLSSMPALAMEMLGFDGTVTAVNPRYELVGKWPCVPTIGDLPDGIDAAIILLPAQQAVEAARALVERGTKALVIVAQGFGESGAEGRDRDAELKRLSDEYGVAICGPNTNGVANIRTGLALSFAPLLLSEDRIPPGRVSIVSQSGALISSILSSTAERGVGIAKFASCGNELMLGVADYLDFFANDPETDMVLLYLETIRDPAGLRRSLRTMKAAGKRVVALKSGQSETGKQATLSHTGAIAGSYRNTIAFLEKEGVAVAEEIETLAALVELAIRYPKPLRGPARPAMVSVSGGYAALAADCMARLGMSFEGPSEKAKAELKSLPIQSHAMNPYDTAAQHAIVDRVFDIFHRDGYNQMMVGLTPLAAEVRKQLLPRLIDAASLFPQMVVFAPGLPADEVRRLQAAGICVSQYLRPQMEALKVAFGNAMSDRASSSDAVPIASQITGGMPILLDEASAKMRLSQAGIASPRGHVLRGSPDMGAIDQLTRPLVLKALSTKIAHKSDLGLVELDLETDDQILAAWKLLRERAAAVGEGDANVMAEEMISDGLEAIVGFQRDPAAGPVVIVGAGGILAEFIDDVAVLVPPLDAGDVSRALDRTRLGRLLRGYRGRSYDHDALVDAVGKIAAMASTDESIQSLDINPLLVRAPGQGVVALDAKIFVLTDASGPD